MDRAVAPARRAPRRRTWHLLRQPRSGLRPRAGGPIPLAAGAPLMQLLTPLVPDPSAPLARANPVAKLGAALVLLIVLFGSLDGVTALVVLLGLAAVLPV